jgi:hypothetical protein
MPASPTPLPEGRIIPHIWPHAALITEGRVIPHTTVDEYLNPVLKQACLGSLGEPGRVLAAVGVNEGTSPSLVQIALHQAALESDADLPEVSVLFQHQLDGGPIDGALQFILVPAGSFGPTPAIAGQQEAADPEVVDVPALVDRLNHRLESVDMGRPLVDADRTYAVAPLASGANAFEVHRALRRAHLEKGSNLPAVYLAVRYDADAPGEELPFQSTGREPTAVADAREPAGPIGQTTPDIAPGPTGPH